MRERSCVICGVWVGSLPLWRSNIRETLFRCDHCHLARLTVPLNENKRARAPQDHTWSRDRDQELWHLVRAFVPTIWVAFIDTSVNEGWLISKKREKGCMVDKKPGLIIPLEIENVIWKTRNPEQGAEILFSASIHNVDLLQDGDTHYFNREDAYLKSVWEEYLIMRDFDVVPED